MFRKRISTQAILLQLLILDHILSSVLSDREFLPIGDCNSFRLANYYQDGMVLQRDEPGAVVWGFGQASSNVTVGIGSTQLITTVQENCIWSISLPAVKAGGLYSISFTSSLNGKSVTQNLDGVLFGDVWLCSGQSNMQFHVEQMFNGSNEMRSGSVYSQIRLLEIAMTSADAPVLEPAIAQQWAAPSAGTIREFSGLCWAFGRRLNEKLNIPIGLIGSYYGGTPIRAWSPQEVIKKCGGAPQKRVDNRVENTDPAINGPSDDSNLWNAMISPLTSLRITGVLWYQGEADASGNPDAYKCLFPAMIDSWRGHFSSDRDMPFGFVQLSTKNDVDSGTPLVRWHQTADYGVVPNPVLKNVFMAVAMDLGDPNSPYGSIHPRYKEEVAERAAVGAFATYYNLTSVTFMGPFVQLAAISGDYIVVIFNENIEVKQQDKSAFEVCCSSHSLPEISNWQDCVSWKSVPWIKAEQDRLWLDGTVCGPRNTQFLRYAWRTTPCAYLNCPVYGAKSGLPTGPFVKTLTESYSLKVLLL